MEREVLITGIGGQGIQLASKILAQAASQQGRSVMHFGMYGGMIRGGPSDCTVVVSSDEILAPPIVEEAWALIAMHPGSLPKLMPKIRSGGVVLSNTTLVRDVLPQGDLLLLEVPATRLAEEAGRIVGASLVALGAFARATGLVSMDALREAMRIVIPPHRLSLIDFNERCLELGDGYANEHLATSPSALAWSDAQRPESTAEGRGI